MAKIHPVPLRLDGEVRDELESLAAASGLSLSDLCRLAIEKFLDEVAVTGQVSLRVSERPAARYGSRPVHRPGAARVAEIGLDPNGDDREENPGDEAPTSSPSSPQYGSHTTGSPDPREPAQPSRKPTQALGSVTDDADFPL